jgi:hypothetical protein
MKIDRGFKLEEIVKAVRKLERIDLSERQRSELWRIINEDLQEYLPLLIHIADAAITLSDTPINGDCFADEITMLANQVEPLRIWSKEGN